MSELSNRKSPNKKEFQQNDSAANLTVAGISEINHVRELAGPSNEIIIINTDHNRPSQPDDDMLTARREKVIAALGDRADMVSIAVQAFNRLEKTKICIDSILRWTNDFDYELILFDNGSTDGTLDYFKSINHPRKKIIRVTKNLGGIVNIVFNHYSGRYLAYIMGDVYVTKNWLKNLLTCMKSDDTIGMVSPVASNVSLQTVDLKFNTLEEMQEKAAAFNTSNPALWQERLALFPAVGLYRREALELGGLGDTGFHHYLADNDFSFRIRRAGFKLILCKDTFVHHDHDRNNPQEKNQTEKNVSFETGRKEFRKKYFGIDAFDDVNNFESSLISLISPEKISSKNPLSALGIDVLCGTPLLELKNKIREYGGKTCQLNAFSSDPRYWLDLHTICDGQVVCDPIETLSAQFKNQTFDYVLLGKPINAFPNPFALFRSLLPLLDKNGSLLLKLHNSYDVFAVLQTCGANLQLSTLNTNPDERFAQVHIDEFVRLMEDSGCYPRKFLVDNWPLDGNIRDVLKRTIMA